jgi:SAM-dependent methyltransferase
MNNGNIKKMKSIPDGKNIDRYADGIHITPRRRQKAAILTDTITKIMPDNALEIVDFGCADGAIPVLLLNSSLASNISQITGITLLNYNDLPHKPAFTHLKFMRVIADLESNLAGIPLPWGQCDIVTATSFFHYMFNPLIAFQHAAALLKPDGYLIITIPVRWLLLIRKIGFPGLLPKNNLIHQINSLDIWSSYAESCGLVEIERTATQWFGLKQTFKIEEIFRKNQMFTNLSTNFMVIYKKMRTK